MKARFALVVCWVEIGLARLAIIGVRDSVVVTDRTGATLAVMMPAGAAVVESTVEFADALSLDLGLWSIGGGELCRVGAQSYSDADLKDTCQGFERLWVLVNHSGCCAPVRSIEETMTWSVVEVGSPGVLNVRSGGRGDSSVVGSIEPWSSDFRFVAPDEVGSSGDRHRAVFADGTAGYVESRLVIIQPPSRMDP